MSFWKDSLKTEYERWWRPTGDVVPWTIIEHNSDWPEHIEYFYPDPFTPNLKVEPIVDAPDPPPDPYEKQTKKRKRAPQQFTNKKVVPPDHVLCSKKILLRPSSCQKKVLRTWFASARHTFNWALGVLKKNNITKYADTKRMDLKTRFVTCNDTRVPKRIRWIRKVPYTINEAATARLAKAFSDRRGDSKDLKKPFRFPNFITKGKTETTINIDKQNFSRKEGDKWKFFVKTFPDQEDDNVNYKRFMKKKDRNWINQFPDGPVGGIKISLTPTGSYYMIVPFYKKMIDINPAIKGHLVATDPGSNPFMTYYSPTRGVAGSIGTETNVKRFREQQSKIDKLRSHIDTLKDYLVSNWDRPKAKKMEKLKKKAKNLHRKCRDLAKDALQKTVNKLTSEYQYVHTSPFKVQSMVLKKTVKSNGLEARRKIRKQTVRDIHGWLHYPFKQALLHKQNLVKGLKVEIISEYLTTKICDSCGAPNEKVGGNKHFKCDDCGHDVNRDVHGARNHCLRNCVERYTLHQES